MADPVAVASIALDNDCDCGGISLHAINCAARHRAECVVAALSRAGLLREPPRCQCTRFRDTGGWRIADLGCPVHGINGTDPGDGMWEDE